MYSNRQVPQSTYGIYLEYHSVCPIVGIRTTNPLSPESKGGHTPAGDELKGVPIRTTGEKA
jgi:hypothetical protein